MSALMIVIIFGVTNPILSGHSSAVSFIKSKQAFILANSANNEALYRLKNNKVLNSPNSITLSSSTASIAVTNSASGKDITITTPSNDFQRNIKTNLLFGTGVSFHYGIQSGQGGFDLNNSSSVVGNVYSGGQVTGSGNSISGDVISSGSAGLIDGINATGTAYARTIQNSTVGKDAYYVTKTNTTVAGTSYPDSPDQADADLPISDSQIEEWKAEAAAGGVQTCTGGKFVITTSRSIGTTKIPCDLEISNSPTVTITGHIWVEGNIVTRNSPTIRIDPALGNKNVVMIADKPTDRVGSSIVTIGNSTNFQGSGTAGSFVFMISQNNHAESGGSTQAITIGNSANALVVYASHGLISLANSVSLKEVTAYKIVLSNSAKVIYDTGLANTLFSAGPGGSYTQTSWREY